MIGSELRGGRVVVDTREDARIDESLASWRIHVERRRLAIGDYLVGERAIVERKTVSDFHSSLTSGRLWLQLGALRTTERWPYLLLEGREIDAGPLGRQEIRGAILTTIERGVRVLRTQTLGDSACWLALLAARDDRKQRVWRPHYSLRHDRTTEGPEAALAAAPGISRVLARALLERFGSVSGVISAGRDEWLSVPGLGPRRAASLAQTLMLSRPPVPAPPPALPAKAQRPST